jgi:hypothetical protein
MNNKDILGLIASTITIASYVPYLWSVNRGITKPHAFSWILWAFQTALACAALLVKGAGAGAWSTGISAAFCGAIAIMGLYKGHRSVSRLDWIMFGIALAALPLWYVTDDPLWSVLLVMLIDGFAFVMTFRKAWVLPHEEMAISYLLYAISLLISLFALTQYNFITFAYPVFILFANAGLALLIWYRRYLFSFRPV